MNIGKAIKELREQSREKQKEAAAGMGITQSYLSGLEQNKKQPSPNILQKIGEYYNCPLAILLWWAVDETDIPAEKRELFKSLKPSVDALISQLRN